MSQNAAIARALAALGHEARLAIYRLLVRAGEEGLNVGEIAAHRHGSRAFLARAQRSIRWRLRGGAKYAV